jgi:general secretion pathway protein C
VGDIEIYEPRARPDARAYKKIGVRGMAVLGLGGVRRNTLSASSLRGPSGWFARRWPNLLALALLAWLCWLVTQWVWYFLAPKAAPALIAPASAGVSFNPGAVTGLFGVPSTTPAPTQQVVVPTTLNVQLKGVFAERGDALSHAILIVDGKEQGFRVGDQLMPGVTLQGVFGDHVLLSRGGVAEKVAFPELPQNGMGVSGGGMPAGMQARPMPNAQAAGGFRLNVQNTGPNSRSLSRSQLEESLSDVSQLGSLGRIGAAPGGGVSIEEVPPGSLAERLGMQAGDVVKQINGQAVNSPADLMRLYQEFDNAEQVNVTGTRAGRPLQLTYNVQQ